MCETIDKELEKLLNKRSLLIKNCSNEDLLDGSFVIKLNEINIAIGQLEDLIYE